MDNTELQLKLIARLQEICAELGLIIGIPTGSNVGAIIGTQAFIEEVSSIVGEEEYTADDYFEDDLLEQMLHKGKKNEDPSFH